MMSEEYAAIQARRAEASRTRSKWARRYYEDVGVLLDRISAQRFLVDHYRVVITRDVIAAIRKAKAD